VQPLLKWKSSITQPICVCVCVALGIQHAMRMRHIAICGLPRSTILFHTLRNGTIFEKKNYWTQNVCFDFLYTFFSETFLILSRNEGDMIKKLCIGEPVKHRLFLSEFNET
jgi:hypothetical protein